MTDFLRDSLVIKMRDEERKTFKEIGHHLGVSRDTARVHYVTAKQDLELYGKTDFGMALLRTGKASAILGKLYQNGWDGDPKALAEAGFRFLCRVKGLGKTFVRIIGAALEETGYIISAKRWEQIEWEPVQWARVDHSKPTEPFFADAALHNIKIPRRTP